jgi:hypothetical protein
MQAEIAVINESTVVSHAGVTVWVTPLRTEVTQDF